MQNEVSTEGKESSGVTPGTWTAKYKYMPNSDSELAFTFVKCGPVRLAELYAQIPAAEQVANAHMMAASKELFEALKLAREDLSIWHEQHTQGRHGGIESVPCSGCSTCEETLPAINAALAKAQRESQ